MTSRQNEWLSESSCLKKEVIWRTYYRFSMIAFNTVMYYCKHSSDCVEDSTSILAPELTSYFFFLCSCCYLLYQMYLFQYTWAYIYLVLLLSRINICSGKHLHDIIMSLRQEVVFPIIPSFFFIEVHYQDRLLYSQEYVC